MPEQFTKRVSILSISVLVAAAVWSAGFAVGEKKLWPYESISRIRSAAKSLLTYGRIVPENLLAKAPPDAARQTFAIYRPDLIMDGFYVFLGWEDTRYAAWLYDNNGKHLHTWTWDYKTLDPDGPLNGSDFPHGAQVLSDGSLIVNVDLGDIMFRLNSCSEPIWVKKGTYHHSLEQAEDGTFWTWRGEGTPYSPYQYLTNFDPETGRTIKELGLVEDIIRNMGKDSVVFGVRPDYDFERIRFDDVFHPNDIDILHSDIAPKFPDFKAGDLLLSFRNLHLVAVLDPDTKRVEWWSHGPWRYQHDPDFTSDGKISVFDNNTDLGRSEIIKIDPRTRELSNDLSCGGVSFFTGWEGKHQYLPNGNVLIVVPEEGRVLEVSHDGDKVLEFNNIVPGLETHNGHVFNGLWVGKDFFKRMPQCSNRH